MTTGRSDAPNVRQEERDLYSIARYVNIPGEAITRFIGALELCGYRVTPVSDPPPQSQRASAAPALTPDPVPSVSVPAQIEVHHSAGGTSIEDYIAEQERDPVKRQLLANARQDMRDAAGESPTPRTDALVARHQAETDALHGRLENGGVFVDRHEWREHSLRQATELLAHARTLEREAEHYKLLATMQRENQEHAERELAEAQKWRGVMAECADKAQERHARAEAEVARLSRSNFEIQIEERRRCCELLEASIRRYQEHTNPDGIVTGEDFNMFEIIAVHCAIKEIQERGEAEEKLGRQIAIDAALRTRGNEGGGT